MIRERVVTVFHPQEWVFGVGLSWYWGVLYVDVLCFEFLIFVKDPK